MIARRARIRSHRRQRRPGLAARILEARGILRLPVRDKKHLARLRQEECEVCRKLGTIQITITEAAHIGSHGMSQKACDLDARPICSLHHRIQIDSAHVLGRNFETYYGFKEENCDPK